MGQRTQIVIKKDNKLTALCAQFGRGYYLVKAGIEAFKYFEKNEYKTNFYNELLPYLNKKFSYFVPDNVNVFSGALDINTILYLDNDNGYFLIDLDINEYALLLGREESGKIGDKYDFVDFLKYLEFHKNVKDTEILDEAVKFEKEYKRMTKDNIKNFFNIKFLYKPSGKGLRVYPIFCNCNKTDINMNFNNNFDKILVDSNNYKEYELFLFYLKNYNICDNFSNEVSSLDKEKLKDLLEKQNNNVNEILNSENYKSVLIDYILNNEGIFYNF